MTVVGRRRSRRQQQANDPVAMVSGKKRKPIGGVGTKANRPKPALKPLTPNQALVLDSLDEGGWSASELAKVLGLSVSSTQSALYGLKGRGLAARREGRWYSA